MTEATSRAACPAESKKSLSDSFPLSVLKTEDVSIAAPPALAIVLLERRARGAVERLDHGVERRGEGLQIEVVEEAEPIGILQVLELRIKPAACRTTELLVDRPADSLGEVS